MAHRYTKGVDMWSVGCIVSEMITGRPLFPGTSTLNQIERILEVLPKPTREDIASIKSELGARVLERIATGAPKSPLEGQLPGADADGLEIVRQLLHFSPDRRLTAAQACRHAYVRRFHNPTEELTLNLDVRPPIDDNVQLTVHEYRQQLYGVRVFVRYLLIQSVILLASVAFTSS